MNIDGCSGHPQLVSDSNRKHHLELSLFKIFVVDFQYETILEEFTL